MISAHRTRGFFWFRVFGYGLVIKDTRIHRKLFSERNRLVPFIMVGRFLIRTLKPMNEKEKCRP